MSFGSTVHPFRRDDGKDMQAIFMGISPAEGRVTFQTRELSLTAKTVGSQLQTSKGEVLGHTSATGVEFVAGNVIAGRWNKVKLFKEFRRLCSSLQKVQGTQGVSDAWMKDVEADFLRQVSECQISIRYANMDGTPPLFATSFEEIFQQMKVEIPDQLRQNLVQCGTWDRPPARFEKYLLTASLSDRDVLCIAQSGSRRVCLLPMVCAMIAHLKSSRAEIPGMSFPYTLILCPTEEGALECYQVVASFLRGSPLRCAVLHGQSIKEQLHELALGVDLLVTTPLCLIPMVVNKIVSLKSVLGFVMVDASYMVDMNMRDFYRCLLQYGMPESSQRLSLILTNTVVNPEVEDMIKEVLVQPIVVRVTPAGSIKPEVFNVEDEEKLVRLKKDLHGWLPPGQQKRILVWVHSKVAAQFLDEQMSQEPFHCAALLQSMDPWQKGQIWRKFWDGKIQVLFATDAGSNGLDISSVDVLLHYHLPSSAGVLSHRFNPQRNWKAKAVMYVSLTHEREEALSELADVLEDVPEWLANRTKETSNDAGWEAVRDPERDQWQPSQWDANESWNNSGWRDTEPSWQSDQQNDWRHQQNEQWKPDRWQNQDQDRWQNQNQDWWQNQDQDRWQNQNQNQSQQWGREWEWRWQ